MINMKPECKSHFPFGLAEKKESVQTHFNAVNQFSISMD